MSIQVNLTQRQQYVLWATVRHYIATAEPVGSKALVNEYNLSVSPATIRNAMGTLEKAGLLYQPHTSAGRVPSDSGYRIYVDQLITPSDALANQAENILKNRLQMKKSNFEAVVRGAAKILANLSGYIALITMPQPTQARLLHIQLVQVETGKIMVLLVTDTYHTDSVLMDLPPSLAESEVQSEILDQELQIVSNFLNAQLRDRSLTDLYQLDWRELGQEFEKYAQLIGKLLVELSHRSQIPEKTGMTISGVSEVLRQPEFSELNQVQMLLQALAEEQDQLWPLMVERPLSPVPNNKRVHVRIGSENPIEAIQTCTLISANYCRGLVPVGSVGVLGPKRMVYENAIALVEGAADYLSAALSEC